jgi:hypothetical protein
MTSLEKLSGLLRASPGRKAVIWVATLSPVSATEEASYWNKAAYDLDRLPMYETVVEELNAAHISVYPLLFSEENPQQYGVVWDEWMGLKQLAETTGGIALKLSEQGSLLKATETTFNDFGPYYILVVDVPPPKELNWVPVKIKVRRPGVTVRAAPGYLGLKPAK